MSRFDSLKWLVYYPALAFVLISTGIGLYFFNRESVTPIKAFESPLRAGDKVYLLTGQWRTKIFFRSERDNLRTTDLLVDVWCFDGKTASTLWRKRIATERDGAMYQTSLLGAQGDVIWISLPSGPIAVSMSDGAIRANATTLESRNPALKGMVPTEARQYRFDAEGLLMTAADARLWRFRTRDFSAEPARPATGNHAPGVLRRAYFTPASTTSFISRSLKIPGHWLGVLNVTEPEMLRTKNTVGGVDGESRRALYGARAVQDENFFGKFERYTDFKQLGSDYLGPGLLTERIEGWQNRVIWLRNPDSVLVLHRDRLGEEGRLQLARIAGPAGRVVWNTPLPLSVLQSVVAGEDWAALYGVEFTPREGTQPRDPMHSALERLVSIDLTNGRVNVHDQHDFASHPEATPENAP